MPSVPVRVEVRFNGRVVFANMCLDPKIDVDSDGGVGVTAKLLSPPPRPVQPQIRPLDERDGDKIVTKAHSGKRDEAKADAAVDPEADKPADDGDVNAKRS